MKRLLFLAIHWLKGTNLVLLQPEVARAFPTSDAVTLNADGLDIRRIFGDNRRYYGDTYPWHTPTAARQPG